MIKIIDDNYFKKDLKFGNVVVTRSLKYGVYTGIDVVFRNERTHYIHFNWNEDLTYVGENNEDLDIILVFNGDDLIAGNKEKVDYVNEKFDKELTEFLIYIQNEQFK